MTAHAINWRASGQVNVTVLTSDPRPDALQLIARAVILIIESDVP